MLAFRSIYHNSSTSTLSHHLARGTFAKPQSLHQLRKVHFHLAIADYGPAPLGLRTLLPSPKLALLSALIPNTLLPKDPPAPATLGGGGISSSPGLVPFLDTDLLGSGISVECRFVDTPSAEAPRTDLARLTSLGRAVEARRRVEVAREGGPRVDTPREDCWFEAVEPHGGRFEREEDGREEVGVGDRPEGREGVAGREEEVAEREESRLGGRTGMEVRPPPPMDWRMAERDDGRVEPMSIAPSLSLPVRLPALELLLSSLFRDAGPTLLPSELEPVANLLLVVLRANPLLPGDMLARGIPLPAMTRFLLESNLDVNCLTRSVMFFMSWIVPFTRLSRMALGVAGAADERLRVLVERARVDEDNAEEREVEPWVEVGKGGRGGMGEGGSGRGAGGERIGVGLTSEMEGGEERTVEEGEVGLRGVAKTSSGSAGVGDEEAVERGGLEAEVEVRGGVKGRG